jgi:hypothetical protein
MAEPALRPATGSRPSHANRFPYKPTRSYAPYDPSQYYRPKAFGADARRGAVTTVTPTRGVQQSGNETETIVVLPFTETWRAYPLIKAEINNSILMIEGDGSFVVDDAALPDSVQDEISTGAWIEVSRLPESDPPQYVLILHKRHGTH